MVNYKRSRLPTLNIMGLSLDIPLEDFKNPDSKLKVLYIDNAGLNSAKSVLNSNTQAAYITPSLVYIIAIIIDWAPNATGYLRMDSSDTTNTAGDEIARIVDIGETAALSGHRSDYIYHPAIQVGTSKYIISDPSATASVSRTTVILQEA